MSLMTDNRRTIQLSVADDGLLNWIEAFLIDRKSEGLEQGSLRFYL